MMLSNWQRDAACVGSNPDLFLAETDDAADEARKFCATCPVREACLAAAMLEERNTPAADRAGIRGGLTPEQRAARGEPGSPRTAPAVKPQEPKVRMRASGPIRCGTRRGYQKHRRNGEEACVPCRNANTDADRRLRTTGSTLAPAA